MDKCFPLPSPGRPFFTSHRRFQWGEHLSPVTLAARPCAPVLFSLALMPTPWDHFPNERSAGKPLSQVLLWAVGRWWGAQAGRMSWEPLKPRGPLCCCYCRTHWRLPVLWLLTGRTHGGFLTARNPLLAFTQILQQLVPGGLAGP